MLSALNVDEANAREMANHYHTIILGAGGAMGSSAAYHLARRGVRVLGLEQFDIAHARGSSHGYSRLIRMCYFEHPDYVPLLRQAYELWRDLERASGARLLHTPGGVYMGREGSQTVAGSLRAAEQHGLVHELLSHRELAGRFPQFHTPKDYVALFEPAAGWLAPERAIRAAIAGALAHGAQIHTGEQVIAWAVDAAGVRVQTSAAEYRADRLVITAGAWAGRVVSDLGVPITPTRQVLGWFTPRHPGQFAQGIMPVWAMDDPESGDLFYGFPLTFDPADSPTGEPVLKLARHARGVPIDPDRDSREPHAADEQDIRPFLHRHLPAADGSLAALRVCIYENSPDGHFVIDRHPKHANVFVAAGFSGHGFKFSSVVGEILADLAVRDETAHPIDFLSLRRFTDQPR